MSLSHIVENIITNLEPLLNEKKVCVYYINLASWKARSSLFWELLCNAEKAHANKFSLSILRDRYITSHGMLRILLSYYINLSPAMIDFCPNKYGKLFLKDHSNVQFNISYSKDVICYALTLSHPIGIDIEWQNTVFDIESIAEFVLTPAEYKFFMNLKAEEKSSTFYEIWSKKEALVKAVGLGLSYPIHTIDVVHMLSTGAIYLDMEKDAAKKEWYIYSLKELPEYSCAIATDCKIHKVICKHIEERETA